MKVNQNPLWRNGQIPASNSGDSQPKPGTDTSPEQQAHKANDRSSKSKRSK